MAKPTVQQIEEKVRRLTAHFVQLRQRGEITQKNFDKGLEELADWAADKMIKAMKKEQQ